MLELVARVNWEEYAVFFSQGTPSIALQLMALNALLLACLMHRRTQKKGKSPRSGGWLLPVLFLAGNYSVVNWGGKLSF